ncbi:hypothetical protein, partial [Corynebacterium durum]|uniref:hypothetical protein n=1 Tax=Corynebacterium durum TaxID=61592 RepID=UPI0028E4224C
MASQGRDVAGRRRRHLASSAPRNPAQGSLRVHRRSGRPGGSGEQPDQTGPACMASRPRPSPSSARSLRLGGSARETARAVVIRVRHRAGIHHSHPDERRGEAVAEYIYQMIKARKAHGD